jgi:hypothetical protein
MSKSPRLEAERLAKALGKALRVAVDGKLSFASVDLEDLARLSLAYSGVHSSIKGSQEMNNLLLSLLVASSDKSAQRAVHFAQEMRRIGLQQETGDASSALVYRETKLRESAIGARQEYNKQ